MYAAQQADEAAAGDDVSDDMAEDDDVVDAEFEEVKDEAKDEDKLQFMVEDEETIPG